MDASLRSIWMSTPWFTSASEGANLAAALSKDQKCAINMDATQEKEEKTLIFYSPSTVHVYKIQS